MSTAPQTLSGTRRPITVTRMPETTSVPRIHGIHLSSGIASGSIAFIPM